MKRETAQQHSLKIIAIFFAVSLWFYVLNSEPVQIEKKLTINYIVPPGFAISNLSEKEVTLKLKGSNAFIQNIFANKEKFTIDLKPYFESSGKSFRVKFYSSNLTIPFGVEVLDISPKDTLIELEPNITVEIPIKVLYIGEVPTFRKLKDVLVEPQNLLVSGPVTIAKSLLFLETSPVNLALFNKDEDIIYASLSDLDPRLKYVRIPKIKLKYKTFLLNSRHTIKN